MERNQAEEIARELMRQIMYDNGSVNSVEEEKFPARHLSAIADAAEVFFGANPVVNTPYHYEEICCGEHGVNEEVYGSLEGYQELVDVLNSYFNEL